MKKKQDPCPPVVVRKMVLCYTSDKLQTELLSLIAEREGVEIKMVTSLKQAESMARLNPNIVAAVIDDPLGHSHKWLRLQKLLNLLSCLRRNTAGRVIYVGHMLSSKATFAMGVDKMPPQLLRCVLTQS